MEGQTGGKVRGWGGGGGALGGKNDLCILMSLWTSHVISPCRLGKPTGKGMQRNHVQLLLLVAE